MVVTAGGRGGKVATTEERDADSGLEATRETVADGDDIVVIPGDPATRRSLRSRPVLVGAVTLAIAALVVVLVVATRSSGHKTSGLEVTSPPTAPAVDQRTSPATAKHAKGSAPAGSVAPKTTPATAVPVQVVPTAPPVTAAAPPPSIAAPATSPATTPAVSAPPATAAAPKQYGPSALTWTAPTTVTIAAGTKSSIGVTAHNPTDGVVTLPHPLSCTPRLQHDETCVEAVQTIAAGASASADLVIDATEVAPGHYTLNIEGVLSIAVTVS
jgi:hypothetical protein